jgi:hypothetical protein
VVTAILSEIIARYGVKINLYLSPSLERRKATPVKACGEGRRIILIGGTTEFLPAECISLAYPSCKAEKENSGSGSAGSSSQHSLHGDQ